jgi:hypothetical protein
MVRAASSGSSWPKMALPATNIRAPAAAIGPTVVASMPPSTSITRSSERSFAAVAAAATLGITSAMKCWPPNPGWTDMTSRRSMSANHGATASKGVSGLHATPTPSPSSRIWAIRAPVAPTSTWTVQESAPAVRKASRYWPGFVIIR